MMPCVLTLLLYMLATMVASQTLDTFNSTLVERGPKRKPPFPSRRQIEQNIIAPPRDLTLYWTGTPRERWMELGPLRDEWAHRYGLSTVFFRSTWKSPEYTSLDRWSGGEKNRVKFLRTMMKVYSELTKGRVYLMMPYGAAPNEQGLFWLIEWPQLRHRGMVTEIIWIDLNTLMEPRGPPDPFTVTKLWWKKGMKLPATYPGGPLPGPDIHISVSELLNIPTAVSSSAIATNKRRKKSTARPSHSVLPESIVTNFAGLGLETPLGAFSSSFFGATTRASSRKPLRTSRGASGRPSAGLGGLRGGFFNRPP